MARGLNSGRLLPLFPLQLVVFPGSATPLHIYEPNITWGPEEVDKMMTPPGGWWTPEAKD